MVIGRPLRHVWKRTWHSRPSKGFLLVGLWQIFCEDGFLVEEGDSEAGITQMSRILDSQPARGVSGRWMAHCAALLAEVLRKIGQIFGGAQRSDRGISQERSRVAGVYYEAELHRIKGELLLRRLQQTNERPRRASRMR